MLYYYTCFQKQCEICNLQHLACISTYDKTESKILQVTVHILEILSLKVEDRIQKFCISLLRLISLILDIARKLTYFQDQDLKIHICSI